MNGMVVVVVVMGMFMVLAVIVENGLVMVVEMLVMLVDVIEIVVMLLSKVRWYWWLCSLLLWMLVIVMVWSQTVWMVMVVWSLEMALMVYGVIISDAVVMNIWLSVGEWRVWCCLWRVSRVCYVAMGGSVMVVVQNCHW